VDVGDTGAEAGVIESVVGSLGLEDLVLLLGRGAQESRREEEGDLEGKVAPGVVGVHVLLVEGEHLVVGDGPGVAEVDDARDLSLRHDERHGDELREHCHRVGHIHHLKTVRGGGGEGGRAYSVILHDFGDEVAGAEVVADGHADWRKGIRG
jgi:hypothetical protein